MDLPVSGIYLHFKGKRYFVIGVARKPYLEEKFVIYRALYDEHLDFARPLEMFMGRVKRDDYRGPRFAFVEAAIAQIVYLVGFSLAHFWDGFTGLTVTVLSIATLFLLMQLTGRIRWSGALAGAPLGGAPPA